VGRELQIPVREEERASPEVTGRVVEAFLVAWLSYSPLIERLAKTFMAKADSSNSIDKINIAMFSGRSFKAHLLNCGHVKIVILLIQASDRIGFIEAVTGITNSP
jgi:hypothetical protein